MQMLRVRLFDATGSSCKVCVDLTERILGKTIDHYKRNLIKQCMRSGNATGQQG
jgi:hypothetical protein